MSTTNLKRLIALMIGISTVTAGLFNEFGENRVIDTPISEAVIAGATVIITFEGIRRAVAVVETTAVRGARRRSVATSDRDLVASSISELGGAGRAVTLDGVGGFEFR